jgi:predicted Zn-dependent peptidase
MWGLDRSDLYVLPEMFSTGFVTEPAGIVESDGQTLQWMLRMAQELKGAVCGSVAVEEGGQFYNRFYRPENAILAIAGGIDPDKALRLAEEAFGHIRRDTPADFPPVRLRPYPVEPTQQEPRTKMVNREVPANALYMAWHMCDRWDPHYYAFDMLSDLLANGHSPRLYSRLVRDSNLFSEINAYITGDLGPGLFVVSGKLTDSNPDSIRQAQLAVTEQLDLLLHDLTTNPSDIAYEMEKAANKYENNFLLSQYKANDRALSLCYYEMIGNSELINNEPDIYRQVTPADLTDSLQALSPDRCSTLGILINSK